MSEREREVVQRKFLENEISSVQAEEKVLKSNGEYPPCFIRLVILHGSFDGLH